MELVYLICNVLSTCSFKSCINNMLVDVMWISTVLCLVAGLPQSCPFVGLSVGSRPAGDLVINPEVGCLYFFHPPFLSGIHIWAVMFGGKRGDYQNCSVLYCVLKLCTVVSILRWAVLTVLWIGFRHIGPISLCLDLSMFMCVYFVFFHTACVLYYCNKVGWTWWNWTLSSFSALTLLFARMLNLTQLQLQPFKPQFISTTLYSLVTATCVNILPRVIKKVSKSKEGYSSLQASLPSLLRELTCHMGSHSVTCHPAEVTLPPLPQPKLVLDLATPEGGKAELTLNDCGMALSHTHDSLIMGLTS